MSSRILIIDDELAVRQSVATVLQTYGLSTRGCASAAEAMEKLKSWQPDCIVLDVRMPHMDGITFQKLLAQTPDSPPVIIITGHGDIAMAVGAIKNGAFDFIEKPIDDEVLVASINAALSARRGESRASTESAEASERFRTLTERERQIAMMVSDGYSTAAIAGTLGISSRTVDHHRANIIAKMQATSLPQLLRLLMLVASAAKN